MNKKSKTKRKVPQKPKRYAFLAVERADWYAGKDIDPVIPNADFNKAGICKHFSNAVVIGKYRTQKKGPWMPLKSRDVDGGIFLPCRHLCSMDRCQSLDDHGLCPIRRERV